MDNIAGGPQQKGKRGCFSLAFIAPPQYSTGPQPRGPHWAYGFSGGQQENWKWHSASLTLWKLSCKILQGLITQGSPEETWKPVHTVYLKVAKRVDHKRFHHILLLLLLLFTKKQLCEVIEVVSNSTVIVCSIHVYQIVTSILNNGICQLYHNKAEKNELTDKVNFKTSWMFSYFLLKIREKDVVMLLSGKCNFLSSVLLQQKLEMVNQCYSCYSSV